LEAATTVAWEGRFGDADLKIEIPPSGRIHAEWRTPAGSRQKVVDSIEQLERSVLFQLMVGANVRDEVREEIADAVAQEVAQQAEAGAGTRSTRSLSAPTAWAPQGVDRLPYVVLV